MLLVFIMYYFLGTSWGWRYHSWFKRIRGVCVCVCIWVCGCVCTEYLDIYEITVVISRKSSM